MCMYMMYIVFVNTVFTATEARRRWFDILEEVSSKSKIVGVVREGRLVARVVPVPRRSKDEIKRSLVGLKSVLKRKRSTVLNTPVWRKKETAYLKRISAGKMR